MIQKQCKISQKHSSRALFFQKFCEKLNSVKTKAAAHNSAKKLVEFSTLRAHH